MKYVCSLIVVENIERSREFYEKTLKQKVRYDFGVNVSFEGDFAIHLKDHYEEVAGLKNSRKVALGSNSFELYFETEKLDEIYEELKSADVEFLHEIEEQPWAQRVIRFYDPDRHIVEVGEAMEGVVVRLFEQGLSLEQIAAKTGMPMEFVDATVKAFASPQPSIPS